MFVPIPELRQATKTALERATYLGEVYRVLRNHFDNGGTATPLAGIFIPSWGDAVTAFCAKYDMPLYEGMLSADTDSVIWATDGEVFIESWRDFFQGRKITLDGEDYFIVVGDTGTGLYAWDSSERIDTPTTRRVATELAQALGMPPTSTLGVPHPKTA